MLQNYDLLLGTTIPNIGGIKKAACGISRQPVQCLCRSKKEKAFGLMGYKAVNLNFNWGLILIQK